jgi:hypothetical protein
MSERLGVDKLELPDELSLIVAWQQRDGYEGGEVRILKNIVEHLLAACERTVERIAACEPRAYTPDMQLEENEVLVVDDPQLVGDSQVAEIVLPHSHFS